MTELFGNLVSACCGWALELTKDNFPMINVVDDAGLDSVQKERAAAVRTWGPPPEQESVHYTRRRRCEQNITPVTAKNPMHAGSGTALAPPPTAAGDSGLPTPLPRLASRIP